MQEGTIGIIIGFVIIVVFAVTYYIIDRAEKKKYK